MQRTSIVEDEKLSNRNVITNIIFASGVRIGLRFGGGRSPLQKHLAILCVRGVWERKLFES